MKKIYISHSLEKSHLGITWSIFSPEKHLRRLLHWLHKTLWLCRSQQTGKFLKRRQYQATLSDPEKATTRTRHGTTDWLQIGKGVLQGCILSPCLFNRYTEYIMWNARLDDSQAGIKIARRNMNSLSYVDDTTLMAGSEEELNSLLKVKEESDKAGLKLNIQWTRIIASGPTTSQQIDGEKAETMTDFIFLGSKITADNDGSHEIKRCLLLGRKAMTNPESILKTETSLSLQRSI